MSTETSPSPLEDFYVQWLYYDARRGGTCTHATREDTNKALCGVMTVDGAGQTLADTGGVVACRRCTKALAKLGITPNRE